MVLITFSDKIGLTVRILLLQLIFITTSTVVKAESIPSNYHKIAIEYQIPSQVLYGVALAESGQRISQGKFMPWPWTLNVQGVARYYPTRLAAYRGLMHYLKRGIRSIDIGFMQVNWRYHRKKLGSPWQALEPFNNLRAAATILRNQYQQTGVWQKAIGRYHSPGQKTAQKKRAKNYAKRVMRHIQRMTKNKV